MPNRFHRILFAASFLMSLAVGIVNYSLIFYVQGRFGADKTAVGLISSALTLTYFAGIIAFLAWRRMHPRFVLWLAAWAMASCVAIYMLVPLWTVTIVFHGFFGLGMSLFWPRIMGWLSWGVEGKDLGATMGRFNFSWSFGGILSPYLGGLMVEADFRLPFIVAAVLLLLAGLLMPLGSRLYPAFRQRPDGVESAKASPAGSAAGSVAGSAASSGGPSPLRYAARLAVVSAYFLSGSILFIFPAFAKESFGFSESLIGSFLLVRMAAATLGFNLWGRWTFWHFRFWPLAAGTLLLVGLILLFPAMSFPWQFYPLFAAAGAVFSFLYSYALFHGVAGSLNRERSMTIHEAAINIGLLSGTVLGGWVSETWSMATAFRLCAAVAAALLLVQGVLALREPLRGKV